MPVVAAVAIVREVVEGAIVVTVLLVEAAVGREVFGFRMAEMPFADDGSFVAGGLEARREGLFVEWETVVGPGADDPALEAEADGALGLKVPGYMYRLTASLHLLTVRSSTILQEAVAAVTVVMKYQTVECRTMAETTAFQAVLT